jgi:hypothetical protein
MGTYILKHFIQFMDSEYDNFVEICPVRQKPGGIQERNIV